MYRLVQNEILRLQHEEEKVGIDIKLTEPLNRMLLFWTISDKTACSKHVSVNVSNYTVHKF